MPRFVMPSIALFLALCEPCVASAQELSRVPVETAQVREPALHTVADESQSEKPKSPEPPQSEAGRSGPDRTFPGTGIWVEGHSALGDSPRGFAAVALDLQPVSVFAVNLSIGETPKSMLTGGWDTHWAVIPRLRLPVLPRHMVIGIGAGYSRGPYTWDNDDHGIWSYTRSSSVYLTWQQAGWSTFELSVENRGAPAGMRAYIGYSNLLTTTPSTCRMGSGSACQPGITHTGGVFYLGAALAFGTGIW
jgi:hypothetical protein